ncbi:hypothetical protein ISF_02954 [Cordyceps fumosorosea ARSEF 2679]|uniref:Uncharacterized protein n=1 Tax=Cordyceps fumosorosea (strain ARSEF 2679) TaxID=1081104 RepID=A0A162LEY0_CORFA|nr:hypothetical protein ISF_02954 [Cordyceps fumosorosea ARSEF 2679]OAA69684.1 hypothetical protein ISF_02954 [Cordyceps fumosorosea ARSEF 2679]
MSERPQKAARMKASDTGLLLLSNGVLIAGVLAEALPADSIPIQCATICGPMVELSLICSGGDESIENYTHISYANISHASASATTSIATITITTIVTITNILIIAITTTNTTAFSSFPILVFISAAAAAISSCSAFEPALIDHANAAQRRGHRLSDDSNPHGIHYTYGFPASENVHGCHGRERR